MLGSPVSRFKTEDCVECGDVVEDALPCDFSGEMGCQHCFSEIWKTCPDCGRTGKREYFDGMYCKECIKESEA